jgi:NitT/TauT family transport system ATP-binding protein
MGPRPTFIEADLPVDLPSPRDQIETKELGEFARVRGDVYRRIRRSSELMRTGNAQATT